MSDRRRAVAGQRPDERIAPLPRGYADSHPFYVLSQWTVAATLRLLAGVRVDRVDRCPPTGPLILASNHVSYWDIPLIGAWVPRTAIFFAKSEVRQWPVVGWVAAGYGTIFVRRGEADRRAIREALGVLAAGQTVAMFPEGHRNHGHGLLRAQPGVALIAQRSRALVWPVAVVNTQEIGRRTRPRVTIVGGDAFDPLVAAREVHGDAPSHQQIADMIMTRVAALLPEPLRGVYRRPPASPPRAAARL